MHNNINKIGSGSDIEEEAWGVPSAPVRAGNTSSSTRMSASTPPAKSLPTNWSTPSPGE
jgi:hypothetical protein